MKVHHSSVTTRVTFCLLLLTLTMLAFGQRSYKGQVYNKYTKQVIPGINIQVTNIDSNKQIANTRTSADGSYYFQLWRNSNVKITASGYGYKNSELQVQLNPNIEDFSSYLSVPGIYLDTTFKLPPIEPTRPVRQSKAQFTTSKLQSIKIVPTPAAYELLYYLNPDLKFKDSLMSDEKINLPIMPRISDEITSANKEPFKQLEGKNKQTQNQLREASDQLIRILSDNIMNYPIKYENADRESLLLMREYLRSDIETYKNEISNTPKLKAETLVQLISTLSFEHENIVTNLLIDRPVYENLLTLWEDLSYVIVRSRYQGFINGNRRKTSPGSLRPTRERPAMPGPSISEDEEFSAPELNLYPAVIDERSVPKPFVDETASFAFLVWRPEEPRPSREVKVDLREPSMRYIVRYFIWALRNNEDAYIPTSGNANTAAVAILTRGRYGVQVKDTYTDKIVEIQTPDFRTDLALDDRLLDNFLIPDYKETKFIIIQLK